MTALRDKPIAEPEVLIEEARRRQRRRHAGVFAAALAIAAGIGIYLAGSGGSSPKRHQLRASANRAGYPWVNPKAFSGEGSLAFVSLGSLFVLDGSSGKLTQVPPLTGADSDPEFSPNRRWLAYETGGNAVGVAAADGASPRLLRNQALVGWLPDGELLTTPTGNSLRTAVIPDSRYRISSSGVPLASGSVDPELMAWAASGGEYVFAVSGSATKSSTIEVAGSPSGRRTVWKTLPTLRTHGDSKIAVFAQWITVLPDREGLLVWTDPGHSDDVDGAQAYLIRSPGAPMRRLGITVGQTVSIGPRGEIALGAGPTRLAWEDKTVKTCVLATASCKAAPAPHGDVSIDPSWSPDGAELAYVQAKSLSGWGFPQATVSAWYATHTLWVLPAGSSTPHEVVGARGAASPVWSADGKTLMFSKDNALWLVRAPGTREAGKPVRIASPIFASNWPSYYGQVNWAGQFTWSGSTTS